MSPRTLTRIIFARLIFAWINFHGFPGIFELLSTKMNPHEIFAKKKKKSNSIKLHGWIKKSNNTKQCFCNSLLLIS